MGSTTLGVVEWFISAGTPSLIPDNVSANASIQFLLDM